MKAKSPISDAEAEVLGVLWSADSPVTTAEICRQISEKKGWDRSTVRTLIRRLVEKRAIEERRLEVLTYTPLLTAEEYRGTQTRSFLDPALRRQRQTAGGVACGERKPHSG